MKLYYATGTCSLSPHIVALEAGLSLDLERVDIAGASHVTETGADFSTVNPNGYVPALLLDDGSLLTEGVAIMLYLADRRPGAGLAPEAGTPQRYRLQQWLSFVSSELHKMYSPWLFHPEYGALAAGVARGKIAERLAFVERHLADRRPFLLGETFTAADAYLFTIPGWSAFANVDLQGLPNVRAFMARVGGRPAVREAMRAEGVKVLAA
jgi:glutathione S-transferase